MNADGWLALLDSPKEVGQASYTALMELLTEAIDAADEGTDAQMVLLAELDNAAGWIVKMRQRLIGHFEGKTYDHKPVPDDLPDDGDRCKTCGEDITWLGPGPNDWLHEDDVENQ